MESAAAVPDAATPPASLPAKRARAVTDEARSKQAARNKRWRDTHRDVIAAKRSAAKETLNLDPVAKADKLARDREVRKMRLAQPQARARALEVRRLWRQRRRELTKPDAEPSTLAATGEAREAGAVAAATAAE